MSEPFLIAGELPFCKGCGHHSVAQNTERALQMLGMKPLDVVIVTDIGCHGIIDKHFLTHTVHGLHGRSVALGAGIALALPAGKKIIVFIGDGGVTIGINHLILAASKNIDMTVIVHNNFLYGMTGGQPSGLTPPGFKTPIEPEGKAGKAFDVCRVLHQSGAALVNRVLGRGDYSAQVAEAISTPGFSLLEVMELCPSYGVKYNPGVKLEEMVASAGLVLEKLTGANSTPFAADRSSHKPSLFEKLEPVSKTFDSSVKRPVSIVLSGSAGEGVQHAAELFVRAAMACGLNVTKKGNYPVTVGVGFSSSEIIVSPAPIEFHGTSMPDFVLVTSDDGLNYSRGQIGRMTSGEIFLDQSLAAPATGAAVCRFDFRKAGGARYAALTALFKLLQKSEILPVAALVETLKTGGLADKIKVERLLQAG